MTRFYQQDYTIVNKGLVTRHVDCVNVCIAFYFMMISLNSNFRTFLGNSFLLFELVFYALFINALPRVLRSLNTKHFGILIGLALIEIVSYLVATDLEVHGLVLNTFFRWCLPLFLLGASIRDVEDLFNKLIAVSIIILILILIGIISRTNSAIMYAYSQDTGYQALIAYCVFLICYFYDRKNKYIVLAFLALIIILIGGARGPLLSAIITTGVVFVLFMKMTRKKVSIITGTLIISVLLLLFYDEILAGLYTAFFRNGFSTRIISLLQSGGLNSSSARHTLNNYAVEYIFKHPFLGTGIINDRRLLYDSLTVDTNKTVFGYYCHNFFLEVCMQIGLVPGVIAGFAFVKTIINTIKGKESWAIKKISVVLVTIGFFPLLVSYSYLSYQYFFLLLGYALSYRVIMRWISITRASHFRPDISEDR